MSQENVEVVRAAFEVLASGDQERQEAFAREHLHPKFQLHPLYFDRDYEGLPGIREFLSNIRDTWEDYALDLQELIDLEERVVTVMQMSARGRGSQVPVVQEIATVSTFAGQKVIDARAFPSRAAALEAVGLSG